MCGTQMLEHEDSRVSDVSTDLFSKVRAAFFRRRSEHQRQGDCISELGEATFLRNITVAKNGGSPFIRSADILPVRGLPSFDDLAPFEERGRTAISQLLVCKLNGGLGTSMGLEKAKSLLQVKDQRSFIEVIIQQVQHQRRIHKAFIPFCCMNSFRTASDTERFIPNDFNHAGIPVSFLQHQVPKLVKESYLPVSYPQDPELEWCPPGHGDLYPSLVVSGLLQKAIDSGYRYLFVSNSDNLGATLNPRLLGYMVEQQCPFLMEVAERTEIDRKGGHLALTTPLGGQKKGLLLRELAQVSPSDIDDFMDYHRYCFFNTNSLWIDLQALQALLAQNGNILPLPVIQNVKRVNPRDPSSQEVVQLETAMGAAISLFEDAEAVVVPRSRFLPVKTTADLLRLGSDIYEFGSGGELIHVEGESQLSIVLDPVYFQNYDQFLERFPAGLPSLRYATSVEILGDIQFGPRVTMRGDVRISNSRTSRYIVDEGAELSGDIKL